MQIVIKNLQNNKIPIVRKRVKSAILNILKSCSKKRLGEVAIYFVDDRKIRRLNNQYLKKDYPTDVLCFDLSDDKKRILAEIFISVDTARRNAKLFKTSLSNELYRYTAHGILHFSGFDDLSAKDAKAMRKKEEECLNFFRD